MKKLVFKVFISLFIVTAGNLSGQARIWNMEKLSKVKASGYGISQDVLNDADKCLKKTITTVMDKEMTPPSGDKHDYMSAGRYWWPDPKNPTGPYIRKDGVVNHEIDKLDRGPLGLMAKNVTCLSLAYYFTSDEKYAAKAVNNLRIWFMNPDTRMNPNMNYGQTIPGRNNGLGRGEGIIDTYSFIDMLDGIELLKSSSKFTKEDQQGLKNWFASYLDWMMTSPIGNEEYTAKNNHGTAFDVQATRYAIFVGKEDIARKYCNDFAARRLFTQIEPDGSQPLELARTTALGYSTFNLTHILDMCYLAKSLNIDLYHAKSADGRCISKALEFLSTYVGKPQSEFPYKQIKDWDEVQTKLCWQLYRSDKLTSTPVFEKYYKNRISESDKDKDSNLMVY
ncbi:MAG: alginate lyase family protein [Paludibacter sp.]|nr:alginate lyase family protein [Paludibacter sp.]